MQRWQGMVANAGCVSIVETFPDEGGVRGGKQISGDSWSLYLLISRGAKVVLGREETKHTGKRHERMQFKNGLMYSILSG